MRFYFFILSFFMTLGLFAQDEKIDFEAVDSLYREDQFYFNFSFSNLQKIPSGFNQNKLSVGLSLGFLRDFPINKNRTWSIAAGLGYSYSGLNHNLRISAVNGKNEYNIITGEFSKNKQNFHYVDLPIEIRWRTSTAESHKFWRVYTGFKVSYLFSDQYKFEGSGISNQQSGNPDLNALQYGTYITAGWNTWNAYVYYGLNPVFKSAAIEEQPIKMHALNIGLMFYIL